MYSGTPCDECGGPTLAFPSGSIWCPDEDNHPGGHFVVRVAFERSPLKSKSAIVAGRQTQPIKSRGIKPQAPVIVQKPSVPEAAPMGWDDFVESTD